MGSLNLSATNPWNSCNKGGMKKAILGIDPWDIITSAYRVDHNTTVVFLYI